MVSDRAGITLTRQRLGGPQTSLVCPLLALGVLSAPEKGHHPSLHAHPGCRASFFLLSPRFSHPPLSLIGPLWKEVPLPGVQAPA